jgi:hypothetical protein
MRIYFFYAFFFSFLIIWWLNKDVFPRKYFLKINVIFWWHQTWQNFNTKKLISNCKKKNKILFEIKHWIHLTKNWKTIQFQLFVWPKFLCKWPKNWCLPIHIYLYLYIYQITIYWSENENIGLNNGKKFRVKVLYFKSKLKRLGFRCTHGLHN